MVKGIAKIDATTLRKFLLGLTNTDPGANVTFRDLSNQYSGTGITPVIPTNNSNAPLFVAGTTTGFAAPGPVSSTLTQTVKTATIQNKTGTSITAGTGLLLYTVTAGKTFYVTQCSVWSSNQNFVIYDSTTLTGTILIGIAGTGGSGATPMVVQTYPTPIAFTNGLFADVQATQTCFWCISGFEQ